MKTQPNWQKEVSNNRHHVIGLFVIFSVVILLLFLGRFLYIMIGGHVNGVDLAARAEQRSVPAGQLVAERGTIYDVGGNPLATNGTAYTLRATLTTEWSKPGAPPVHVPEEQKGATAETLSHYLDLDKDAILKRLNTPGAKQVEFGEAGRNLSFQEKEAIAAEHLQGIDFDEHPARAYPNGKFASHLIGYADLDTTEDGSQHLVGKLGIERAFESELAGEDGFGTLNSTPGRHEDDVSRPPVNGKNVYLTLDSRLQSYLEKLVSNLEEEASVDELAALLVDPKTGKIAAATQRPTFNPETREGLSDLWQNLLVEKSFEPGSTLKVLTLAAAIEEGVFHPEQIYQSGSVKVKGGTIHDYNTVGWGAITQLEGIARSSNVLVVQLVQAMGYDTWKNYMLEFGLTQPVESNLAHEDVGYLNYDIELDRAITAFGQGVRVTPWQLVQAFTAIANGGKMVRLQYVDRIEDADGTLHFQEPETVSTPISAETAQKTLEYLTEVVDKDYGSGRVYRIDGTEIAAKTGTAQVYDEENGGYLPDTYINSVVGFAPADEPRYIFYLSARNLQSHAGKGVLRHLADVFVPFVTRALEYSKLDDDRTSTEE